MNPKKKNITGLGGSVTQRLSRGNKDKVRHQRAELETWSTIIELSERYEVLPIDFLSTVMDLCGKEVEEKLDLLFGHRSGTTLKL